MSDSTQPDRAVKTARDESATEPTSEQLTRESLLRLWKRDGSSVAHAFLNARTFKLASEAGQALDEVTLQKLTAAVEILITTHQRLAPTMSGERSEMYERFRRITKHLSERGSWLHGFLRTQPFREEGTVETGGVVLVHASGIDTLSYDELTDQQKDSVKPRPEDQKFFSFFKTSDCLEYVHNFDETIQKHRLFVANPTNFRRPRPTELDFTGNHLADVASLITERGPATVRNIVQVSNDAIAFFNTCSKIVATLIRDIDNEQKLTEDT